MSRALLVALSLLVACRSAAAAPSKTAPVVTTPPRAKAAPPRTFPPSTEKLAVLYAARALLDPVRGRVFVRRDGGIDVFELASGKRAGHVDIGWDGEMWPTATRIVTFHAPAAHTLEATIVDPVAAKRVATCSRTVKAPADSAISRVDAFTYRGQPYLKWETAPPPQSSGGHGGARMTEQQMKRWTQRVRAAYACGLLAIHVQGGSCSLDEVSYRAADLASCQTRNMPPHRAPAKATVGHVKYAIEHDTRGYPGPHVETTTLVVRGPGNKVRWRTVVEKRQYIPPPP